MAEGFFVLAADDGKSAEHVTSIVPRQAVEVEIEGIKAGAQVVAIIVGPGAREGRAGIPKRTVGVQVTNDRGQP